MPKGWLKHNRLVGKKASLGGGSKKQCHSKRTHVGRLTPDTSPGNVQTRDKDINHSHKYASREVMDGDYDDYYDDHNFYEEDDYDTSEDEGVLVNESETIQDVVDQRANATNMNINQQCPICCEDRPLIALMKDCNHPPACYHCLRQIYVIQAQQSVNNYPLQCYHPSCNKDVRDTQLKKHNLVRTEKELEKHYRFTTFAKVYKKSHQQYKVVHCPDCDTPRAVMKQESTKCRNCRLKYLIAHDGVTNELTTLAVLQSMKSDSKGPNDGFARCPRCKIFISKGYGCDHMICACGQHFSWAEALNKQRKVKNYKIAESTNKISLGNQAHKI
mmetsp:Transcript_14698/g.22269  ORF Transcript_14698/g.22269 Transcript_14698/m.22269 type:complete len:330 (+) Transcript_14698:34-1023(+)